MKKRFGIRLKIEREKKLFGRINFAIHSTGAGERNVHVRRADVRTGTRSCNVMVNLREDRQPRP